MVTVKAIQGPLPRWLFAWRDYNPRGVPKAGVREPKKQKSHSLEWAFKTPAASYSPTGLPLQYHRP